MSGITFTGLASGLDTGALIDQLVAAEKIPADTLTSRQSDLSTQKSIVSTLSSQLAALGAAARGMDLASELSPRVATVSDSHLAVAVSSAAAAAAHTMRVKQLAAAQVTSSKTFASPAAGALGAGGLSITVAGTTKSVSWTATDSLDDIATKITNANAGVSASVLFDGSAYRLVVTATVTGTAAAPTFVDTGDGLDLSNAANIKVPPKDAIVTIDGFDVTRPGNVIADALAGVTLTLSSPAAVSDPDTKVVVGLDNKALTDKVKGLVDAYNKLNASLHVQLDFTGTKKGTNTLFGDSTLRQLQGQLATVMSSAYGTSNLGALGISRDKTGAMTLDETKLAAALASDSDAVAKVFVTGGFATAVATLADSYTTSGTGLFAAKTESLTNRSTALQQQIDRITKNADMLRTRLEKQFGALEEAMSALQSQSQYLASFLK
jgi:flagellar hook-associated protein 2